MVKVVEWASCNKSQINFKKTNRPLFASGALLQHRNSFEIKIVGALLNFTNVAKYFGIIIDNQFSWKDQTLAAAKKFQ